MLVSLFTFQNLFQHLTLMSFKVSNFTLLQNLIFSFELEQIVKENFHFFNFCNFLKSCLNSKKKKFFFKYFLANHSSSSSSSTKRYWSSRSHYSYYDRHHSRSRNRNESSSSSRKRKNDIFSKV
jgi:hypothetical protein